MTEWDPSDSGNLPQGFCAHEQLGEDGSTVNQFDIEGVYLETCGCGDNCHCCEPGGHTQPGCQVKATWRIDKGEAGNTSLAGVTLAAIYDYACVESRGSQGRLLVNDGTTPEQRRALAQVFASQSQMQPAGMGRLLQDLTQTEYAQVSVVQQGDRFQVQVKGSPPAMPCQRRARNRRHPRTWRSLHSNNS